MDTRLYFLLNLAQQSLRKRVDDECVARVGLTSAQMGVLFYLAKHDGCLLKELGEGLGVKNAAVTGLVDRTERTGCIRRAAHAADGRATQLHLTARGRQKLAQIHALNKELNERLHDGFNAAELDIVRRFLQHVIALSAQRGQVAPDRERSTTR